MVPDDHTEVAVFETESVIQDPEVLCSKNFGNYVYALSWEVLKTIVFCRKLRASVQVPTFADLPAERLDY